MTVQYCLFPYSLLINQHYILNLYWDKVSLITYKHTHTHKYILHPKNHGQSLFSEVNILLVWYKRVLNNWTGENFHTVSFLFRPPLFNVSWVQKAYLFKMCERIWNHGNQCFDQFSTVWNSLRKYCCYHCKHCAVLQTVKLLSEAIMKAKRNA